MRNSLPDWKTAVRQRLAALGIDATRHVSVIEELAQHLEERHQSLIARGLSAGDAERSVRHELDDDALQRELVRAERALPENPSVLGDPPRSGVIAALAQDCRYATRALRKSPGFTCVAVVTLALGVGVNTAIFSVVNAVMLRPLPYGEPDRLVRIFESNPERGWPEFSASHPNFLDWRSQATSWEALAATSGGTAAVDTVDGIEIVRMTSVTADFLPALGISPALGRNFRAEEDRPGGNTRVAILADGFWRRAFGADPSILSRTVSLNGAPHTVIGVLPPHFDWGEVQLLLPLAPDPARHRGDHRLTVIGLLKAGVTFDQARAELTGIAANLARLHPKDNEGWSVRFLTFYDWLIPASTRESLVVLQGAVALVLLIACVNVANLLLARGAARQKELAIRVALGASRGRIVWHGVMESVLLALGGATAGLGLAAATIRLLSTYESDTIPRLAEASIDAPVLAFASLTALISAALFGLIPSVHAAREHGGRALHDSSRGATGGRGRQRMRTTLTVAEVALSVALLIGAGLLLRSFVSLQQVDPGFDARSLMTGRVMLASRTTFDTPQKRVAFWRRMIEEVGALPGVGSVSTVSGVPLTAGNTSTELEIPGVQPPAGVAPSADWRIVTPRYFSTMRIPLRGRDFEETDGADRGPSMIISEALARLYWPHEDPLGKTIITRSLSDEPHTIIGVAGDVRSVGLDAEPRPMVYYSGFAVPVWNVMYVVWRSTVDPASQVAPIREAIRAINPQVALYDVASADDLLSNSFGARRLNLYLLGLFAAVALALAAIGLFGVMAYLVSQRTREIGVRLALGADRVDVFRLIVGRGVALASLGAVLGVIGAFWLTRLMENLLFSVSRTDPGTFLTVPAAIVIVAVLACYIPARRAMRVDPVTALRAE
jgi:predicted permease